MNVDPFELRMKNILEKGEDFALQDTPIDCDSLKIALSRVAEDIELWTTTTPKLGSGIKRGKGIACAVKDGGGTRKAAHASVKIAIDGSVVVLCGSVEVGQGVLTMVQQIVAEELTVPLEKIFIGQIDTSFTPFDQGTNASSATTLMGAAVFKAAQDARGLNSCQPWRQVLVNRFPILN